MLLTFALHGRAACINTCFLYVGLFFFHTKSLQPKIYQNKMFFLRFESRRDFSLALPTLMVHLDGPTRSQVKLDDPASASLYGLFGARLMDARKLLSVAAPETAERYKEALRIDPTMLTAWRELAAYYGACGMHHASLAALESASSLASSSCAKTRGEEKISSGPAAPLRLQMAANLLGTGESEEGLAFVGDAFRVGKGGTAGHVLRGFINLRLGKDKLAAQSFEKAKDAEAGIARVVDDLVVSSTPGVGGQSS